MMRLDETPAAELWRQTLSKIPSLMGRLAYLASLRNPNSGRYEHFGFAQRFSAGEAHQTMRRSHRHAFSDWLCYSLEQQKEDFELYLDSLGGNQRTIIENWADFPPFAAFVPPQTEEAERSLYMSDVEITLELLKRDLGVVSTDRGASRRR